MKTRKIRGHLKIWKAIKQWETEAKNFDIENLHKYQRNYTKIAIHPYNAISIINRKIPQPKGATKTKILQSLIAIYTAWEKELELLEKPYYLKIWLFDNNFSTSQVVCAIGDTIDYYENLFPISKSRENLNGYSGAIEEVLVSFQWEKLRYIDPYTNRNAGAVWIGERN